MTMMPIIVQIRDYIFISQMAPLNYMAKTIYAVVTARNSFDISSFMLTY